ncbi:PREDICTED: UPF0496 protein At1g20180-like [Nelumbo nucifera]|uniref:UPF0496 protein At1g20180-like n=2 Tax=Nelumbo nucifera TaxID=4432 RepID=A0A1U8AJD3_NELNU|nr:PREDICTED: UPF0496 protein At1g20180-like [Nelumbo nucifera]DAD41690.1 TPA_asm: hypothetical protein HUJ06_016013 [Nelumbo nucifera]
MSQVIRKIMWPKLRSSLTKTGSGAPIMQHVMSSVRGKLNVNEEYMKAFRTQSYMEIWSKAQVQLRKKDDEERVSSLSPVPSTPHLSDFLLEPQQDILTDMIKNSNLHHLLIDYFQGSIEASKICEFLLKSIDQTRVNYCIIRRILNETKRLPAGSCDYSEDECKTIFRDLDSFAKLNNPLSGFTSMQFRLIHDRYGLMLKQLRTARKRVTRRKKLIGVSKKAVGLSLVIGCSALSVVTLALAVHALVGLIAAPGLISFSLGVMKKQIRSARVGLKTNMLARLSAQLDAAAKGVYILDRDFDTISRLVERLQDEIEHGRVIARMGVRNRKILKEVVREFQTHESCFLDQLGELEDHVYLCFLTINAARRLVVHEIMVQPQQNT